MSATSEQLNFDCIDTVSDAEMLGYLIKEVGKTKEELATEIRERFWARADLTAYLNKP